VNPILYGGEKISAECNAVGRREQSVGVEKRGDREGLFKCTFLASYFLNPLTRSLQDLAVVVEPRVQIKSVPRYPRSSPGNPEINQVESSVDREALDALLYLNK
jgi:hypothetical protein